MFKKLLMMAGVLAYGLQAFSCTNSMAAVPPGDLLGLSVGMSRIAAEDKLRTIATLERREEGRQQLWRLKGDPAFNTIAVGYDKEDRVRYLTAFVDKATAKVRISFASVGDISKARSEITGQHHRYIWTLGDQDVSVYGDDQEFITIYTLVRRSKAGEPATEEDEDD
jgi:hypothetical protein